MKIIQEIERGKSKSDVARELGLASSTVATIWKNRVSIAESWRNRDIMQTDSDTDSIQLIGQQKKHNLNATSSLSLSSSSSILTTTIPNLPSHAAAISLATPPITTSPSTLTLSLCPSTPTSTSISSIPTSPSMIVTQHQDITQQQLQLQLQAQTQTQSQELMEVRM